MSVVVDAWCGRSGSPPVGWPLVAVRGIVMTGAEEGEGGGMEGNATAEQRLFFLR